MTRSKTGITHPFPIRPDPRPRAGRHDIIGQAKTGTGKTLASASRPRKDVIAPDEEGYEDLLNGASRRRSSSCRPANSPSRLSRTCAKAAKYLSTHIVEIYGSVAWRLIEALQRDADIVVGTLAACTCPASKPSSR